MMQMKARSVLFNLPYHKMGIYPWLRPVATEGEMVGCRYQLKWGVNSTTAAAVGRAGGFGSPQHATRSIGGGQAPGV
jgi:hypothetical protein